MVLSDVDLSTQQRSAVLDEQHSNIQELISLERQRFEASKRAQLATLDIQLEALRKLQTDFTGVFAAVGNTLLQLRTGGDSISFSGRAPADGPGRDLGTAGPGPYSPGIGACRHSATPDAAVSGSRENSTGGIRGRELGSVRAVRRGRGRTEAGSGPDPPGDHNSTGPRGPAERNLGCVSKQSTTASSPYRWKPSELSMCI